MKLYKTLAERTIGHIVQDKAALHGDRTFMFFKEEQYSYKELNEKSSRIANALREMGVKKGDKIVTVLPNFPEYLLIWWGVVKLGAWHVVINNNYRGESLADVINRSDAKIAFIAHGMFLDRFRSIQDKVTQIEKIVVAHRLTEGPPSKEEIDIHKFKSYTLRDLMSASTEFPKAEVFNYDVEGIEYTSGTTGPPKGAVLTHEYMVYFAEHKVMHMETAPHDIMYNCLPMCNLTGEIETCLAAFLADAQLALAEGFNPKTFWDDIRKYNCTEFVSMGGAFAEVAKEPERPDDANNPLNKMYIIPLGVNFEKSCKERFGIEHMVEIYGSTEAGIVAYRDLYKPVLGSAGKAHCDYEIKIFDEHDNEVPFGTEGEIVIRNHKPHIMFEEYYNMPDKTSYAKRGLWYHTGDIGKMDKEGNLYFIRRKADSIRVRGNFCSTTEIERLICRNEDIIECAAYGIRDERGEEEEIMVAIRVRDGITVKSEDILRSLEDDVPYFMIPRYIRFVDNFEKTPTMRIIKKDLINEGIVPNAWDRRKAGFKLRRS